MEVLWRFCVDMAGESGSPVYERDQVGAVAAGAQRLGDETPATGGDLSTRTGSQGAGIPRQRLLRPEPDARDLILALAVSSVAALEALSVWLDQSDRFLTPG
jgi:hypothetical protein